MTTAAHYLDLLQRHSHAIVDWEGVSKQPWHETLQMMPLVPKTLRSDEEKMPALLLLGGDAPYLEDVAKDLRIAHENGFKPLVSCLLTVPPEIDPKRLQQNFTKHLVLQNPRGRAFFRYYDPLVFLHLDRILRQYQLMRLYGFAINWTVRFQKDWITLPAQQVEDFKGYPLSLVMVNTPQQEGLDRIGTVNLALKLWREKSRRPFADLDEWRALAAQADACIAQEQKRSPDAWEEDLARHARNRLFQLEEQQP